MNRHKGQNAIVLGYVEALAAGGSREDMGSPCILQGTTIKATFVKTIVVYKKKPFHLQVEDGPP